MAMLNARRIAQVALIVRDIEATAKRYAEVFGLPLPNIITTDPEEKAHTQYHDQGTPARARLAFFQFENITLELIEPDAGPSTWRDYLDTHGEGVHHLAFEVTELPAVTQTLATGGMPLAQKGDYTGGRYAYIESTPSLKVMLEFLENL